MSAVLKRASARALALSIAAAVVLAGVFLGGVPADAATDTGSISGTVTDSSGAPVQGIDIDVYGPREDGSWGIAAEATTAADGTYTVDGLADGDYRVWFSAEAYAGTLLSEWWNDSDELDGSSAIPVAAGASVPHIDAVLDLIGEFAGTVTDEDGEPLPDIDVIAQAKNVPGHASWTGTATTDGDGQYAIGGLPEGQYTVYFSTASTDADVLPEWWNDATSVADATAVTIRANDAVVGVDAALAAGGVLSGVATDSAGQPAQGAAVSVYVSGDHDDWTKVASATTDAAGAWRVAKLAPGNYRVSVKATVAGAAVTTFWGGGSQLATAALIAIGVGQERSGIDIALTAPLALQTATPTIQGVARFGDTLTAVAGAWTAGTAFEYQWLANGAPISGATGATFAVAAAQVGSRISVRIEGTLDGYLPASATSAPTAVVVTRPLAVGTPAISGTVAYGSTLTAKPGSWTSGATLTYQWYADGKAISGATKSTLKLAAAQKAKRISVIVTGRKAGYTTAAKASASTGKVATAGTPTITGTKKVGKKLTVKRGTWTSGTKFSYQWYANGVAIMGATKSTLTLKSAQKGKKITVKVTGKKSSYATVAKTSSATSTVK